MNDTVTTKSVLHGDRTFRRVGEVKYQRTTPLAVWQSSCVICGSPFDIKVPAHLTSAAQTKAFGTTTCPAHRMTPEERLRVFRTRGAERQAVFDEIKAQKLAAS